MSTAGDSLSALYPGALDGRPILPGAEPASGDVDSETETNGLQRFHLGAPRPESSVVAPGAFLPALLYPFRHTDKVSTDFPVFLDSRADNGDDLCEPVADLLRRKLEEFAPGAEQARILRDNLARVERLVRNAVAGSGDLVDAASVFAEVGRALQEELNLGAENAQRLQEDYDAVVASLPSDGQLLGFSEQAALHLMLVAARNRVLPRRAAYEQRVLQLCRQLRGLLEVEHSKGNRSGRHESLGTDLVDPDELARVVGPQRGSTTMGPARRKRIQTALEVMEAYLSEVPLPMLTVLTGGIIDPAGLSEDPDCRIIEEANPCGGAAAHFDDEAARFAPLFRAARTAELEIAGTYDPARCDSWFEGFDWEAFSREELQLLPPIAALESADNVAAEGMLDLSQLLLSGRPVQVLLILDAAQDPGAQQCDPFTNYRLELGYLGMSHREAFVQQSTAARPKHLVQGFLRALEGTRGALQLVASGCEASGAEPSLGSWLHAGAAVEGRAHALFRYDPEQGATWARRLDFSGNPEPARDWPVHVLPYAAEDGEEKALSLAFTFADFVLLEPAFAGHFAVVPGTCSSEDLVELSSYLELSADEMAHRIPYVWAVDTSGHLSRLAVTRRLVHACLDRLRFWRTLQELAGVRNEHVVEAVARARQDVESKTQDELAQLQASHAEELERVRSEATGAAMQGLAKMLLDTDAGSLTGLRLPVEGATVVAPPVQRPAAPAEQPTEQVEAEAPAEPAAEPEESVSFDEPWIESVLCTSCNDCINLNPKVFVYDENKQAYIADATAGTYAQIVEAAEKCPADCIHPGMPLDKSEPDLEELIKRAEPFN